MLRPLVFKDQVYIKRPLRTIVKRDPAISPTVAGSSVSASSPAGHH